MIAPRLLGWPLRQACTELALNPETPPEHLLRLAEALEELGAVLLPPPRPDGDDLVDDLARDVRELRQRAAHRQARARR